MFSANFVVACCTPLRRFGLAWANESPSEDLRIRDNEDYSIRMFNYAFRCAELFKKLLSKGPITYSPVISQTNIIEVLSLCIAGLAVFRSSIRFGFIKSERVSYPISPCGICGHSSQSSLETTSIDYRRLFNTPEDWKGDPDKILLEKMDHPETDENLAQAKITLDLVWKLHNGVYDTFTSDFFPFERRYRAGDIVGVLGGIESMLQTLVKNQAANQVK